MTVKELIDKLSELEPELPVFYIEVGGWDYPDHEVEIESLEIDEEIGKNWLRNVEGVKGVVLRS